MPHKKTKEKISEYGLAKFERAASSMRGTLRELQMSVRPFKDHYNALSDLDDSLKRTENLLKDRPADYVEPHQPPLSAGRYG